MGLSLRTRASFAVQRLRGPNDYHPTPFSQMGAYLRVAVIATPGMISLRRRRSHLRALRDAYGSRSGACLILAAGPSSSLVTIDYLDYFKACGGRVMSFNGTSAIPALSYVDPDYLLLADPAYFDARIQEELPPSSPVRGDLARAKEFRGDLFVPISKLDRVPPTQGRVVPFVFDGLEGWTSNIDPTRRRGYSGLSVLAAIALATYMGHKPILLSGVEMSQPSYLRVGDLNESYLLPHHAYGGEGSHALRLRDGPATLLADVARCLADFDLFRDRDVVNVSGPGSLVHQFPRACLWAPSSATRTRE